MIIIILKIRSYHSIIRFYNYYNSQFSTVTNKNQEFLALTDGDREYSLRTAKIRHQKLSTASQHEHQEDWFQFSSDWGEEGVRGPELRSCCFGSFDNGYEHGKKYDITEWNGKEESDTSLEGNCEEACLFMRGHQREEAPPGTTG